MTLKLDIGLEHLAAMIDLLMNATAEQKVGFVLIVCENLSDDLKSIDTSVLSNMQPDISAAILRTAADATTKLDKETEH